MNEFFILSKECKRLAKKAEAGYNIFIKRIIRKEGYYGTGSIAEGYGRSHEGEG